ncbi:MAG: hypothetical protein ACK58J_21890, partial [Planctomyces sp.]
GRGECEQEDCRQAAGTAAGGGVVIKAVHVGKHRREERMMGVAGRWYLWGGKTARRRLTKPNYINSLG